MSENDLKPSLRFKGFTDAWEQRKLGEIFDVVTDYVAAGSFADLSENVEYRSSPDYAQLVRTTDLKANFTNTNFIYVDESAFNYLYRVNLNKESIVLPNIGNCGEVYYIRPSKLPYKNNVLGPNAILIRSDEYSNEYLSYLLQAKDFQQKLELIVSPNGQTKFNKTDLKKVDVLSTFDKQEQEKIGQVLFDIDSLITLHQRKYEELQNIKKSLLQKMFPDDTSDRPKVRFKGFTDAWEQHKVSECATYRRGSFPQPYGKEEWYNGSGSKPFVQVIDVTDDLRLEQDTKQSISILAQPMSVFMPKDTVVVTLQGSIGKVAISQYDAYYDRTILLFDKYKSSEIDKYFWALTIKQKFEQEKLKAPGGTIKTITKQVLSDFEINLTSQEEQKKIGKIFFELDSLITLHQRKYEKLQNIKKSLLERMFI